MTKLDCPLCRPEMHTDCNCTTPRCPVHQQEAYLARQNGEAE